MRVEQSGGGTPATEAQRRGARLPLVEGLPLGVLRAGAALPLGASHLQQPRHALLRAAVPLVAALQLRCQRCLCAPRPVSVRKDRFTQKQRGDVDGDIWCCRLRHFIVPGALTPKV